MARPLGALTRTFPSVGAHLAVLDGLRGIALLLVVASHGSIGGLYFIPGVNMAGAGKTGVWLFFVLSSFLLMHQFLQLDAQGRLGARAWGRYALRRVLRIYPLYTVFLLACWLLPLRHQMPPMSAEEVWGHLTLQRGYWLTWSIVVEFKYYLVLPLMVLAYLHVARRSFWAATVLAAAAVGAREWLAPEFHVFQLRTYVAIFIVGSWVAVARHHLLRHPDGAARVAGPAAFAACALFALAIAMTPSLWSQLWGVPVAQVAPVVHPLRDHLGRVPARTAAIARLAPGRVRLPAAARLRRGELQRLPARVGARWLAAVSCRKRRRRDRMAVIVAIRRPATC